MAGPSFQMSFAAVAAMIAAHEWWLSLPRKPREPGGWGGICSGARSSPSQAA